MQFIGIPSGLRQFFKKAEQQFVIFIYRNVDSFPQILNKKYKFKTSFVYPEGPKVRATKTGFYIMILF